VDEDEYRDLTQYQMWSERKLELLIEKKHQENDDTYGCENPSFRIASGAARLFSTRRFDRRLVAIVS